MNESTTKLLNSSDVAFVTDGGLETTLVFLEGIDLPDFAAFPLLDRADGRCVLSDYYRPYFSIAAETNRGLLLDTPTWRANPDWASRLGYDEEQLRAVNMRAVEFIRSLSLAHESVDVVLNGAIGPRGDGYVVDETMTSHQAEAYHRIQIEAFAAADIDMVTAVTMTHVAEAVGITNAAAAHGLPVVIGFTVETNGRLPSGARLGDAIRAVDAETDGRPVWYMVNCAHPSHFERELSTIEPWLDRIGAIRANASRMSHDELDEATELDRGNPLELAADYRRLNDLLPRLVTVGGCCGTDAAHIAAIADALVAA